MSTQITTGKVRFSYCSLFEPKANNNSGDGQEKYSVTLLIEKSLDLSGSASPKPGLVV